MINSLKYGFLGLLLLLAFVMLGQHNLNDKHMKVIMREVGHEFLMQMNDSVSRVLPIHNEDERYKIQFEKSLDFEPDLLLFSAIKVFEKHEINTNSILEVEQCYTKEVVYSYEYDPKVEDAVMACKSRPLPKDCYEFYFTFIEEEASPVVTSAVEESKKTWMIVLVGGLLVVLFTVLFIKKSKKNTKAENLIRIGKYQFDKHRMKLILDQQIEELSSKEADLLELLVNNANQTVEREQILNVVWNDEGDYVGRTLDVSISKLRKKLQADPSIKIINIRGVGYRLTIG